MFQSQADIRIIKEIVVDLGGGVTYHDDLLMRFLADLEGDADGYEVNDIYMERKGGFAFEGAKRDAPFVKLERNSPLDLLVRSEIAANKSSHDEDWQILLEDAGVKPFCPNREYGTHDARAL